MPPINLSQYQFDLRDLYQPGQTIGPLEANILNYHRADLIRKLVMKWMTEAERNAPADGVLTLAQLDRVETLIDEFDRQYEMVPRERPNTPAFTHQLWLEAVAEIERSFGMSPDLPEYPEFIKSMMENDEVRARARRALVSHLKLAEDVSNG